MKRNTVYLPVLGVFLIAAPFIFQTRYSQHVLILVLLYVALGSAWNILGGFAGQLSVGHAAFFGIGAYTAAVLASKTSLSPWWAIIAGPLFVLPIALAVGWICFRLRGPYFTLSTIAIGEMVRLVALNWSELTGGAVGVVIRPSVFSGTSKIPYYYIVLVIAVLTVALCQRISRRKLGYYLMAIREDQETAESIGIDTTKYKLVALAISASLTAIGGAFYANYFLFVDPTIVLPLALSVEIVLMSIIGGLGTVAGPVLGAVLLKLSSEVFRNEFAQANLLIYGALLVVVILFMPGGLMGGFRRLFKFGSRKAQRVSA
ncbi:MAG TPA: branched-chain amino acid ABC transporter permease [Blastocatellia bacterium]|jgi:ABC-type branched-chain amino acid transport system, permease component|nr:branched-chain amino acid ABC transporter permease [Blastocatellia bacterium]